MLKRPVILLTIMAFLAMAWIVFRADHNSLPPFIKWYYDYPGGDKLGHFILFGILAGLLDATLRYRDSTIVVRLPLAAVIVAVAEAIEEASQSLMPSRTLDITDLLASWLGIVVFVLVLRRYRATAERARHPGG